MADVPTDTPIRVSRLATLLGVAPATVVRWHQRGVPVGDRRVYLEADRIGGVWRTTWEAWQRFRRQTNDRNHAPLGRAVSTRRRASERAAERLSEEFGI